MWEYNFTPDPNELYHWGIKGMTWGKHKYKKVVNGEYVYDDDSNSGSASSNVSGPRFDAKDLAGEYAKRKASGAANKIGGAIKNFGKESDSPKYSVTDIAGEYARRKASGAANKVSDEIDRAKNKLDLAGGYIKNKAADVGQQIEREASKVADAGHHIKKEASKAADMVRSGVENIGDKAANTARNAVSAVKYQFDPANKTRGTNKMANDIEDQRSRIDAEKASRTDHGPGGKGKVAGDIEAARARYYECHDRLQEIYGEMDKIQKTLDQHRRSLETARDHGLPSGRLESEIKKLINRRDDLMNESNSLQNEAGQILSKDPELKRAVFDS